MSPVLFDVRGNVLSKGPVKLSLSEIEQVFVVPFGMASTRFVLFEEYKRYIMDLRILLGCSFYQWIDGSFASKEFSPNDIDLVSFINYETYQEKEHLIDERFSKWAVGQYYKNLDAFTVWAYPSDHKYITAFQADTAYWHDLFGHSRYNRNRKRFTKGFIQITVD